MSNDLWACGGPDGQHTSTRRRANDAANTGQRQSAIADAPASPRGAGTNRSRELIQTTILGQRPRNGDRLACSLANAMFRPSPCVMLCPIILAVLAIGCDFQVRFVHDPNWDPWEKLVFPETSEILHEYVSEPGIDRTDAILVRFEDDATVEMIVSAYTLTRCDGDTEPRSFLLFDHPDWWTTEDLKERYARTDENREVYWSLWVDRDRHLLYVERGSW